MYYTANLRKYDMGVLQLGFLTFPIHFIPPGAESFMSYGLCKTEKFEEVRLGGSPSQIWSDPQHIQPAPDTWTMTTAWCSGKSLTGITQEMEGVRALGTGGVGQGFGPGKN